MKTILIFLSVSFFFHFSSAQSLTPGVWKAQTSFNLNGIPLPPSESEECVSKESAKDVKETITKELKKKGCELTKWNLKGEKLEASLTCKSDDLDAKGNLKGKVTSKSYSITGNAEGTYKNLLPSSATLALNGQWNKPCP